MSSKVTNFSDLIQRVTASCLLHPLAAAVSAQKLPIEVDVNYPHHDYYTDTDEEEEEVAQNDKNNKEAQNDKNVVVNNNNDEMEALMNQVFDSVSSMKRAYVTLQEAHSPWDPEKIRVADVAVVGELRKLAVLKERYRRRRVNVSGGKMSGCVAKDGGMVREVVAPYEAAVVELKREVKAKEMEVDCLKEKLRVSMEIGGKKGGGGGGGRRRVSGSVQGQVVMFAPANELFVATMRQVKESLKSFTSLLLSLMRAAKWDIAAAVRSIETASNSPTNTDSTTTVITLQHAKLTLQSYISRKIFEGFDHETFYMDGSLSSLLNPDLYRRECFTQYQDMKAMDPTELLGILPTCPFGKFCSKKYLSIVHPKMEESLFGHLEQHNQVVAGNHPRSQFYGEYLGLAKAIWLLHLLAFSLDPVPSQFEVSRGAEFHPQYMESVVKFPGGSRMPAGQVVMFPVTPGFKLGNGSVIKSRVYVVPRVQAIFSS